MCGGIWFQTLGPQTVVELLYTFDVQQAVQHVDENYKAYNKYTA